MIARKATLVAALIAMPGLAATAAEGPDINHGRLLAATGGFPQDQTVACARCHQLDGSGDSSGAFPRLTDQSAWYLYKTLQDYAAGLRPSKIMEPIARSLTSRDMQDLAAYFASIDDAPYPAEPETDPQVLQIGGAVVAVGDPERGVPACASCHGPDGVGSPPIYPFIAGQYAPYLEDQLHLWKEGRREGDPLSIMRVIAEKMSDEQIHAVSLYLASVREEVTPNEGSYLSFENVTGENAPRGNVAGDAASAVQGHLGALTQQPTGAAEPSTGEGQMQSSGQNDR